MKKRQGKRGSAVLLYIGPLIFLLIFLVYPLITIILPAFTTSGGVVTLGNIIDLLSDERSLSIIRFTVAQAAVSTFLTILLAFPGAYLISRYRFPGRSALISLTTVPFVLPPLVLGIGFISIFGTNGYLQSFLDMFAGALSLPPPSIRILYTKEAIVIAHIFLNFPLALRILHSRFNTLDENLLDASRSLGAGPVRTFFKVLVPQMRYSLVSAASLVFTFCLLTFGVVVVVGGMSNATIELEIYRQFTGIFDDSRAGALLAVEVFIVALSTGIYLWSGRKTEQGSGISRGAGLKLRKAGSRKPLKTVLIFVYASLLLLLVVGPMAAVVHDSFVEKVDGEDEYTTRWFGSMLSRENDPTIGVSPMGAILNSLMFGILTVVVSVPMAVVTAYAIDRKPFRGKRLLDGLLLFPLGVSTIALGLGMIKGFSQGWLDLTGTWIAVLIVHTIIAYPLGVRALLSVKRSIPDDLVRASRTLGASRVGAFLSIDLPLLMPGILIASVFAFTISLGEFGATLMVSSPEYTTMPLALYKFIAGGRDFGSATAYSTILMLVTFSSILAMDLLARKSMKGEVGI
jgi:thiamine transport system permease protein